MTFCPNLWYANLDIAIFRMSKATLSLIPLLGIQYALIPYMQKEFVGQTVQQWTLPISLVLTASHGIVVSFLYCFTSNEMREAIQRRWRLHKELKKLHNEISSRRQSRVYAKGSKVTLGQPTISYDSRNDTVFENVANCSPTSSESYGYYSAPSDDYETSL